MVNHDPNFVLGRTRSGTLSLVEDDIGLRVRVRLPDTSYVNDLREVMRRGDVSQMSFGFAVRRDVWLKEDGQQVREVIDADLFDVSVVALPAYTATDAQLAARKGHQSVGPHTKAHDAGMRLWAASAGLGTVSEDVTRLVRRLEAGCQQCAAIAMAYRRHRVARLRLDVLSLQAAA